MRQINDWAYIDDDKRLHLNVPALLKFMEWENTPANREVAINSALAAIRDTLREDVPAFVVDERGELKEFPK